MQRTLSVCTYIHACIHIMTVIYFVQSIQVEMVFVSLEMLEITLLKKPEDESVCGPQLYEQAFLFPYVVSASFRALSS